MSSSSAIPDVAGAALEHGRGLGGARGRCDRCRPDRPAGGGAGLGCPRSCLGGCLGATGPGALPASVPDGTPTHCRLRSRCGRWLLDWTAAPWPIARTNSPGWPAATRPMDDPWRPLTAREYAVARLIADGRTNGEIADELGIAPKTASSHVEHILAEARRGSAGRDRHLGEQRRAIDGLERVRRGGWGARRSRVARAPPLTAGSLGRRP